MLLNHAKTTTGSSRVCNTYPLDISCYLHCHLTATVEDDQEGTLSADVTISREMINPTVAFISEVTDLEMFFSDDFTNNFSYAWNFGNGTVIFTVSVM